MSRLGEAISGATPISNKPVEDDEVKYIDI